MFLPSIGTIWRTIFCCYDPPSRLAKGEHFSVSWQINPCFPGKIKILCRNVSTFPTATDLCLPLPVYIAAAYSLDLDCPVSSILVKNTPPRSSTIRCYWWCHSQRIYCQPTSKKQLKPSPYIQAAPYPSVEEGFCAETLVNSPLFAFFQYSSVSRREATIFNFMFFHLVLCIHLPVFNLTQPDTSDANTVDCLISLYNLLNCRGMFYIKMRASRSPSSGALRCRQNIVWILINNKSHISRSRCTKVPSVVPQPPNIWNIYSN